MAVLTLGAVGLVFAGNAQADDLLTQVTQTATAPSAPSTTTVTAAVQTTQEAAATQIEESPPPAAPTPVATAPVQQVQETAAPVVKQVTETAAPVVQQVQETAAPVTKQVQNAAAPVVQQVQETAAPVTKQVQDAAAPVVKQVTETAAPVVQQVTETAAPVVQQVKETAAPLTTELVGASAPLTKTSSAAAGDRQTPAPTLSPRTPPEGAGFEPRAGPAAPTPHDPLLPAQGIGILVEPGATPLTGGLAAPPTSGTRALAQPEPFSSAPIGGGGSAGPSPLIFLLGIFAALVAALSVAAQRLSRWLRLTPDLCRPPVFVSLLERPG